VDKSKLNEHDVGAYLDDIRAYAKTARELAVIIRKL